MQSSVTAVTRVGIGAVVLALLSSGRFAEGQSASKGALLVSYPYGGCTLNVASDGSASLFYGSMPRWVLVPTGAFDLKALTSSLLRLSMERPSEWMSSKDQGSVQLPGSTSFRIIQEGAIVRELLERAWTSRTAPTNSFEHEDYAWVASACSFK
jgi:hypothetical protein